MFGRDESLIALEATVKDLRARLERVELAQVPFRAGEIPMHTMYYPGWSDPRPEVTHKDAIKMLLQHCGVEFKAIPGTPARVVLEKTSKK